MKLWKSRNQPSYNKSVRSIPSNDLLKDDMVVKSIIESGNLFTPYIGDSFSKKMRKSSRENRVEIVNSSRPHHAYDANFSHPCIFCAPTEGVPLGIEYRRLVSKTRIMGLPAEKDIWPYLQPSVYNARTWWTNGRIRPFVHHVDGHRTTAKTGSAGRHIGEHRKYCVTSAIYGGRT